MEWQKGFAHFFSARPFATLQRAVSDTLIKLMCEAQAGLITGLLDHTLGQLEEKPFQPGEFDKTLG